MKVQVQEKDGVRYYGRHDVDLPRQVRSWVNLSDAIGSHFGGVYGGSLAADNDDGSSFNDIAETIRNKTSGLFKEQKKS